MTDGHAAAVLHLGRADVDDVLELVVQRAPVLAQAVKGGLVAPVELLVDEFVQTLVAQPQTQRTYDRACRRFVA